MYHVKMIRPHSTSWKGVLNLTRIRRRPIADWYSQSGSYRQQRWNQYPSGPIPTNLVLDKDEGGINPGWDLSHSLFQGQESTSDENHGIRNSKDLRGRGIGDIGGAFFNQKKRAFVRDDMHVVSLDNQGINTLTNRYQRIKYSGPVLACIPQNSLFPTYAGTNLNALGTTAIARCKPTNSIVELSTTLGETIHDGLPKILGHADWKPKTKAARRAAGDEYLNVQFGWLPLVSDVQGSAYALANARKIIDSYERNSGKKVRRRYDFPVEKTESTVVVGPRDASVFFTDNYPGSFYDVSKPQPNLIQTNKFVRRTWFSGAFTYYLPRDYHSRHWLERNYAQAQHLLGLELDPSTVWNLAPWSWAVDWVSNLGDIISNVSDWASDGLVMQYGYIMEHTLQEITYSLDGPTRIKPYGSVFASPITFQLETKRRSKASPFGFGVNFNSFTSRQKAIVVALGLSRS